MNSVYIHYGSKEFDKTRFQPIKNHEIMAKPEGGLWASQVGCEFGWKEWCDSSKFKDCTKENSFTFTLAENANILYINSVDDLEPLPKIKSIIPDGISSWVTLDFEALMKDGVDAIQVDMSNEVCSDYLNRLHYKLYGWDCDSILILNKDVIITQ